MNTQARIEAGPLVRWLPMVTLQLYLGLSVLAFAFGPWPWPVYSPVKLYSFLIAAQLALLAGYAQGIGKSPRAGIKLSRMNTILIVSIVINLLFIFPTAKARTGAWIPDIRTALADPGAAYDASLDLRSGHTGIVEYLRVILGPLLFLLLPWAIYYWRTLSRWVHISLLLWLVLWISVAIGMGTRKALADLILIVPWLVMAGHYSGHSRLSRKAIFAPVIGGAFGIAGFIQYFANGQVARRGGGAAAGTFGGLPITADFNHWSVAGLSPLMKIAVTQLVVYITQGYYALSLALEKPWVPMFGIGHSTFLFRNVARTFGSPQLGDMPYPVRVTAADGWDYVKLWDSIYPWLASDLSFPGTIIAMYVIGRLLARSWRESLEGINPLAVAVFSLLMVLAFYIPANNQCCQDGEGFTSFHLLIAIWLVTAARSRKAKKYASARATAATVGPEGT